MDETSGENFHDGPMNYELGNTNLSEEISGKILDTSKFDLVEAFDRQHSFWDLSMVHDNYYNSEDIYTII